MINSRKNTETTFSHLFKRCFQKSLETLNNQVSSVCFIFQWWNGTYKISMINPAFLWQPIFSEDTQRDFEELFGIPLQFNRTERERVTITEEESRSIRLSFYHLIVTSHFFKNHSLKAGRPSEITPKKLSKFLLLLSEWKTIEESAPVCGFSPASFYRFQTKNPEFRDTIARLEKDALPKYIAPRNIVLLLQKWDKETTFYMLEKLDPAYRKGKYLQKPKQLRTHRTKK